MYDRNAGKKGSNNFMNHFIDTPKDGYWFRKPGIRKIEEKYNSIYMGYWCLRTIDGGWSELPVDIFYQPEPDHEKGHTNYFGMLIRGGSAFIVNGESAFSDPITGVAMPTGEVLVSRFRHDYVNKDGYMIDGGRDYVKHGSKGKLVDVKVRGSKFVFEELKVANE